MADGAVYARVSTDEQAREGFSLDEQQRLALERAARDGLNVSPEHVYVDAMSGKRADRPAYQQMLAAAAAGAFETLYVWKFDRLGRDAEELLRARRMLEAAGVSLVSLTEGEAEGTLVYGVRALVAQEEREKIAERTRLGLAAVAKSGRSAGGNPPLGYRRIAKGIWTIDEHEAAILHRIDAMYLAGTGVNTIARTLTDDGIRSRNGGKFAARVILDILDNPAYRGLIRFKGELYPGSHPPLRDEETWERIQALRAVRKQRPGGSLGRPPQGRHLLTRGLLRCGKCGRAMGAKRFPVQRSVGDKLQTIGHTEWYACTARNTYGRGACDARHVRRKVVDEALLEHFLDAAHDHEASVRAIAEAAAAGIADARAVRDEALRAVQELTEQLARIRRDYRAGALPAGEWLSLRDELEGELQAAHAELEQHEGQIEAAKARAAAVDAESELLDRLARLRAAVATDLAEAEGLEAARAALLLTFEKVVLFEIEDGGIDLVPFVREEAVDLANKRIRRMPVMFSDSESPAPETHFLFGRVKVRPSQPMDALSCDQTESTRPVNSG